MKLFRFSPTKKRFTLDFRMKRLLNGGEEEIRTLDPHVANVMLYQLSYFPMC